MSALMKCGLCCMLISIWGVIQLSLMGVFYKIEATSLISDVRAQQYDNYDDFIAKTKNNYSIVALNCFIAAAMYVVMIGISYYCLRKARKTAIEDAKIKDDDELSCSPHVPKGKPTKKTSG